MKNINTLATLMSDAIDVLTIRKNHAPDEILSPVTIVTEIPSDCVLWWLWSCCNLEDNMQLARP